MNQEKIGKFISQKENPITLDNQTKKTTTTKSHDKTINHLIKKGSIKLCFFLNRISNYTYENIDYEINKPYLNQYELNNQIYYLECKTYLFIKISDLKDL